MSTDNDSNSPIIVNGVDEITKLPNEVYDLALKEVIQNNLGNVDDYEIEYSAGSGKGDNYIGILYRVIVRSKKDGNVKLNLIVKLPPQEIARREQFSVRPVFLRESQFYEEVYPIYQKFQEDKGIDVKNEGFYQVPLCFKSMTKDLYEGLIFEDLKASGFEMYDRLKNLTIDHVLITVKVIAKMHAVFFAIKDQKPELIADLRNLTDAFLERRDDPNMSFWFDNMRDQARASINNCDPALIERVDEMFKKEFFDLYGAAVDGKAAEPYAVTCHGDCWNNNMLYRYENEKPVDIRMLDFQIMRYASPVCDLMYYIFGCTTKELRDKHYNDILDAYYETLSSLLERLGSDPQKVFPRHAFDDHLKRFGIFGLLMGICVIPIFTSQVEDIPDMDELARKFKETADAGEKPDVKDFINFSSSTSTNACNVRMRDVFIDMYNLGYI